MTKAKDDNIISIAPAMIPYGAAKGRTTDTVLEVLLDDGSSCFRCSDCEYEANSYASVFAHRKSHFNTTPTTSELTRVANVVAHALKTAGLVHDRESVHSNMIDRRNAMIDKLKKQLDEERAARRKAERKLDAIKNSLGL